MCKEELPDMVGWYIYHGTVYSPYKYDNRRRRVVYAKSSGLVYSRDASSVNYSISYSGMSDIHTLVPRHTVIIWCAGSYYLVSKIPLYPADARS